MLFWSGTEPTRARLLQRLEEAQEVLDSLSNNCLERKAGPPGPSRATSAPGGFPGFGLSPHDD